MSKCVKVILSVLGIGALCALCFGAGVIIGDVEANIRREEDEEFEEELEKELESIIDEE